MAMGYSATSPCRESTLGSVRLTTLSQTTVRKRRPERVSTSACTYTKTCSVFQLNTPDTFTSPVSDSWTLRAAGTGEGGRGGLAGPAAREPARGAGGKQGRCRCSLPPGEGPVYDSIAAVRPFPPSLTLPLAARSRKASSAPSAPPWGRPAESQPHRRCTRTTCASIFSYARQPRSGARPGKAPATKPPPRAAGHRPCRGHNAQQPPTLPHETKSLARCGAPSRLAPHVSQFRKHSVASTDTP